LLARAALEHRSDDTAEVIAQHLALYHAVASPILAWYRDRGILVSLNAVRSAAEVGREILAALEAMRPSLDHAPRAGTAPRGPDLWGSITLSRSLTCNVMAGAVAVMLLVRTRGSVRLE
jgi:hypothetical protein